MNSRKILTFPKRGRAFINVLTRFFIRLMAFIERNGRKTLRVLKDFKFAIPGIKSIKLILKVNIN